MSEHLSVGIREIILETERGSSNDSFRWRCLQGSSNEATAEEVEVKAEEVDHVFLQHERAVLSRLVAL